MSVYVLSFCRQEFNFKARCIFCDKDVTKCKKSDVSTITSPLVQLKIFHMCELFEGLAQRITGFDLIAMSAKYHRKCYKKFSTEFHLLSQSSATSTQLVTQCHAEFLDDSCEGPSIGGLFRIVAIIAKFVSKVSHFYILHCYILFDAVLWAAK